MKIKIKTFDEFLKKINCSDIFQKTILNFGENGVSSVRKDETGIAFSEIILDKSKITDYEQIGEVGINNIKSLRSINASFKDEIEIKIKDNLLCISEGKEEFEITVPATEFLTQDLDIERIKTIPYTLGFKNVGEIFNKVANSSIALNSDTILISIKNKVINMETGTDNDKFKKNDITEFDGNYSGEFGSLFKNLILNSYKGFSVRGGESGLPIELSSEQEGIKVKYTLAPIVRKQP